MFTPDLRGQESFSSGILIVDVDYWDEGGAYVCGVIIPHWGSNECAVVGKVIDQVADYEPGAFYKRELPCIMALLEDVTVPLTHIMVDGYVTLGSELAPGLGHHLYQAINRAV